MILPSASSLLGAYVFSGAILQLHNVTVQVGKFMTLLSTSSYWAPTFLLVLSYNHTRPSGKKSLMIADDFLSTSPLLGAYISSGVVLQPHRTVLVGNS